MTSIKACVVIASYRLFPARERRRQVLGILRAVQGPTRAQSHCVSCHLYEEDGYEEAILYVEQWDSEPEFQRHVCSDLYRHILESVELSRRNPEIQFHQVTQTRGMDLLEEIRALNEKQSLSNRTTN